MKLRLFRRLTARTIKTNFKQFLSVILIVLLSTMLLSGFITNSRTLGSSIENYFNDTNLADIWVYASEISEDDENFLKENDIKFNKRLSFDVSGRIDSKKIQNNTKLFVIDKQSVLGSGCAISEPVIEKEIYSDAKCYIDKNVAKDKGIEIGYDELEFTYTYQFAILGSYIPIDINLKFLITGTMSLDECADTYSSWPVVIDETYFLSTVNAAIEDLIEGNSPYKSYLNAVGKTVDDVKFSKVPCNQILIDTNDAAKTTDLIKNYYAEKYAEDSPLLYILDRNSIESVVLLNSEIEQSRKMIFVFPIIFVIVAILVILTTIDQLIVQERTRIGTLKSIGIPDNEILLQYSKYGAVLCLIGSVIGIILGVLVIPKIMFIKYNLVYSLPSEYIKLDIPIWWLLLVLFAMVLLGFLVALSSCKGILHKRPIECLRQDIGHTTKLKGKTSKNKKLPLSIKMASRNIRLKPARTIMATIGIAGCMALLLCGFGIGDTLTYSLNKDLGETFYYDIYSTYSSANESDFLSYLDGEEKIENYEKVDKFYVEASANQSKKTITLYQIVKDSKFTSIQIKDDEVWLTKAYADELKIGVGDTFDVSAGGVTKQLKLTNIIETSALNGVFVGSDCGFNAQLATKGVWIKSNDVSDEFVEVLNEKNGTDGAYSLLQMRDNVFQKVSSIDLMTTTLKTFAILLAVIVLFNLIILIIKERVRELATLKVLGTGIFSITLTIFFEVLFMAVLGTAVGMALGYPLLVLVLVINKVEIINFLYHINPLSFLLSILIIFATISLVSLLCTIKVKKIDMIESLKSVE